MGMVVKAFFNGISGTCNIHVSDFYQAGNFLTASQRKKQNQAVLVVS